MQRRLRGTQTANPSETVPINKRQPVLSLSCHQSTQTKRATVIFLRPPTSRKDIVETGSIVTQFVLIALLARPLYGHESIQKILMRKIGEKIFQFNCHFLVERFLSHTQGRPEAWNPESLNQDVSISWLRDLPLVFPWRYKGTENAT